MADYISREDYCEENCGKENREGYKTCHNCSMLNVPSADVQPVRRGKMTEYLDKKEVLCMINKLFSKNVDGTTANCVYNNALLAVKREIAYCSVYTDVKEENNDES